MKRKFVDRNQLIFDFGLKEIVPDKISITQDNERVVRIKKDDGTFGYQIIQLLKSKDSFRNQVLNDLISTEIPEFITDLYIIFIDENLYCISASKFFMECIRDSLNPIAIFRRGDEMWESQ